ncbi:MAG: clostripain-related cysteine peptidase [Lysobacterales bacterium]
MDLSSKRRWTSALATALLMVSTAPLAQNTLPEIPERYQVIDLSPYTAIAINDDGDVLLGDLYFDTDAPGIRLANATYSIWRDSNRDAEIDPVELTLVCSYQLAITGSVKPEFSIQTYYNSSSSGCAPVAINNEGQVLATDGNASATPFNCSQTACELMVSQRSRAQVWQDGSSDFFELLEVFDNGVGQTTQQLRLFSLDNEGRFTGEGSLADPSFAGSTAFFHDGSQRFLPRTNGVINYSPMINDLGLVALKGNLGLVEADGTETDLPSNTSYLDLNNQSDLLLATLVNSALTFTVVRDDGNTVTTDLPVALNSVLQGFSFINDQGQLALTNSSTFPTFAAVVQDDNNDGVFTEDEYYDLRDRVGDQLIPQEVSQVIDFNNRGQLLVRGQKPVDIPEGNGVRNTAKDYLLVPEKPWLVMVALAYDDTDSLSATVQQSRLDELLNDLEAGAQNPEVQVVAMVDSPTNGDSAYYVIKPDDDDTTLGDYEVGTELIELGELDITNPGALIQFVAWARSNFPASREILMLDGAGGPGGLMKDNTSLSALGFMTMRQLQVALSDIGSERILDLLVLNNPHLAMLEVGFSVREGAHYMIASQTHIWHNQASYRRMLERLPAPGAGAEMVEVAINLTQALGNSRIFDTVSGPVLPAATSLVNLTLIDSALDLANLMALALNANLPLYSPHLQAALDEAQYYDTNGDLEQNTDDNLLDLVTFYIFLQRELLDAGFDPETDPLFSDDIDTALTGIIGYVVDKVKTTNLTVTGSVEDSFGVSIFFPSKASHFYDAANYPYASGAIWNSGPGGKGAAMTPAWGEFLVNYFALTDPDGDIETELPQPRVNDTLPDGATQRTIFINGFE